jgi:membrane protease YdiL (CAAX protease family)
MSKDSFSKYVYDATYALSWSFISAVLLLIPQIFVGFLVAFYLAATGGFDSAEFTVIQQMSLSISSYVIMSFSIILGQKEAKLLILGLQKKLGIDVLRVLICFIGIIISTIAINIALSVLVPAVDLDQKQAISDLPINSIMEKSISFLAIIIVAPIAEELLFRGLLFGRLATRLDARTVIIITSILFGLVHIETFGTDANWSAVAITANIGAWLGYLRYKTNGIGAPIMLHALNNLVTFSLVYLIS